MLPLWLAVGAFLVMVSMNRFGIHRALPFFITGLFIWFFMLESGVHATIAGIIAALTIPSKPRQSAENFR